MVTPSLLGKADYKIVVLVNVFYVLGLYLYSNGVGWGSNTGGRKPLNPSISTDNLPTRASGEIAEMVLHAWKGYSEHANGADELRPLAKMPKNNWGSTGVTAFDSLSTLLLLGLKEEFLEAAEMALTSCSSFDPPQQSGFLASPQREMTSVFETTIRHLGAALSAYTQTKDQRFLDCAELIATSLLPAFDTPTGIALHGVMVGTHNANNEAWAGHRSILSEAGSLQIEFRYLAALTGKQIYSKSANAFTEHLLKVRSQGWPENETLYEQDNPKMPHKGLWPTFIDPRTGKFAGAASMASLSDSFYEYLLKQWILFGKRDQHLLELYEDSVEALLLHLLRYTPKSHLAFIGHVGIGYEPTMDHLACFVPGMLILGVMHGAHRQPGRDLIRRTWGDNDVVRAAVDLAATCYRLYLESPSGIGPEIVQFHENGTYSVSHPKFILRPETIESLFYLYRYTKDPKYKQWGKHIATHIDKHCRTSVGFAALESVVERKPRQVDSMESFFLAETLKYLYLLLEEESGSAVPLDQFVFNTEAHPLPILTPQMIAEFYHNNANRGRGTKR
jgi:hypothetical protein